MSEVLLPRYILDAIRVMPDNVLERWAVGPWPEPFCGVCRSLDEVYGTDEYPVARRKFEACKTIVEWHDEMRTSRSEPYAVRAAMGYLTWLRCKAIYKGARTVLAERRS